MAPEKDPTYGDQSATIGESDHPQHRAGPGEGIRAPMAEDGADHAEMSVFDAAGNEKVVAVADDDEGRMSQGTGDSSAEALADAHKTGDRLGHGYSERSG